MEPRERIQMTGPQGLDLHIGTGWFGSLFVSTESSWIRWFWVGRQGQTGDLTLPLAGGGIRLAAKCRKMELALAHP